MKTLPADTTLATKDTNSAKRPFKVCMHVTDAGYPDYRVMREATALVEAGYEVSMVDIIDERERPAEEDIAGVHMRHVFMPSLFIPTRFKPVVSCQICGDDCARCNSPCPYLH